MVHAHFSKLHEVLLSDKGAHQLESEEGAEMSEGIHDCKSAVRQRWFHLQGAAKTADMVATAVVEFVVIATLLAFIPARILEGQPVAQKLFVICSLVFAISVSVIRFRKWRRLATERR